MKKVRVPCDFGDRRGRFTVYVGRPAPGFHPAHYQAAWLRSMQGGVISDETMNQLCMPPEEDTRQASGAICRLQACKDSSR